MWQDSSCELGVSWGALKWSSLNWLRMVHMTSTLCNMLTWVHERSTNSACLQIRLVELLELRVVKIQISLSDFFKDQTVVRVNRFSMFTWQIKLLEQRAVEKWIFTSFFPFFMDLKLPELGVLKTCKIRLLIGVLKPPDSGGVYYLIQMVLGVGTFSLVFKSQIGTANCKW